MSQAASVNDLEAYVNSAFGDEDDDESADEEADENLETKRCLRTFQAFRNAVFPQIFPVFWLIIPFITCAILSFYIFVDPMLRGKHIQMWRSSASGAYSAIDSNPNATLVRLQLFCMHLEKVNLVLRANIRCYVRSLGTGMLSGSGAYSRRIHAMCN